MTTFTQETATWQTARNVLAVRLDNMGDVLMTTPAIAALRRAHPQRRLTLLTSPAGAEVAALVPEIDEIIVYDAPWIKSTAPRESSEPDLQMARRLRRARFDAAAIFTVYSQNPLPAAFLCYLGHIPLRLAHCHENSYQLLTDWIPDPEPHNGVRHEVQRQLDLVASVGAEVASESGPRSQSQRHTLSLRVPPAARRRVRDWLAEEDLDARPWVAIHAGASAPSRRYAPDQFAQVARELVTRHGLPVIFTGTAGERDLVQQIRQAMNAPSYSTVGELSLAELAALLQRAPVVITNNSGPAHVAAAVGTPVVDLYALTNPQHTPWGVLHRVLYHDVPCKYCYRSICPEGHHNCLRLVEPETVVQATLSLLQESADVDQRLNPPAAAPIGEVT